MTTNKTGSATEKFVASVLAIVLGVPFVTIIAVINGVVSGAVLAILWNWFIVTTFHAPALTFPTAFALSLVANYITVFPDHIKSEFKDDAWAQFVESIVMRPLVYLSIGYAIKVIWLH